MKVPILVLLSSITLGVSNAKAEGAHSDLYKQVCNNTVFRGALTVMTGSPCNFVSIEALADYQNNPNYTISEKNYRIEQTCADRTGVFYPFLVLFGRNCSITVTEQ